MSHYQQFEPPFEIPDSWEWVKLGEITSKIGSGSTPKGSNYSEQGIPFFRSQNIHNHGLVYDDIKYISQSIHESMSSTIVHANDLLLNITGGSIGRCAVVPYNFEEGNVSQHVCIIRPLLVRSNYLHFYILSDLFWKSMKLTGSGREGLPKYNLEMMSLPLPPLGEQHRIVDALKGYNRILSIIEESSNNILSDIAEAKSKILELAMQGKLVPQDPTDEPAADMLKRVNPKAKILTDIPHSRNIPSNWVLCRFGDIAYISRGGSPRPIKSYITNDPNGVNWIKIGDTDGKYINSTKEKIIREGVKLSREVKKGDLLLTNSMSFGKPYILNIDGCIHDGWLVISPKEESYDKEFLYYLLSSQYAYSQFSDKAGGAVVSNLNSAKVANTSFPLLSILEQKRIVAKIEELYACLDKIETSLQS